MPAERVAKPASLSNKIDENGVPTIASSIPLVLLGLPLFFGCALAPFSLFVLWREFSMAASGQVSGPDGTWELDHSQRLAMGVMASLQTLYVVFLCWVATRFFQRKSSAPRWVIALFAYSIAMSFAESMWESSFAEEDGTPAAVLYAKTSVSAVWSMIWIVYLWRSRWVQRVFVYPLAEGAIDGVAEPVA